MASLAPRRTQQATTERPSIGSLSGFTTSSTDLLTITRNNRQEVELLYLSCPLIPRFATGKSEFGLDFPVSGVVLWFIMPNHKPMYGTSPISPAKKTLDGTRNKATARQSFQLHAGVSHTAPLPHGGLRKSSSVSTCHSLGLLLPTFLPFFHNIIS